MGVFGKDAERVTPGAKGESASFSDYLWRVFLRAYSVLDRHEI